MSDQNQTEGQEHYSSGDDKTKEWFHTQWKIWPKRADERFTTNMSFHYGGVLAYREEHKQEPPMSEQFKSCVAQLDRYKKG